MRYWQSYLKHGSKNHYPYDIQELSCFFTKNQKLKTKNQEPFLMIDLHTHSLYSDGELVPAELWRRAQVKGYRYLAITDHVDASNFEVVFARLQTAALSLNRGDYPVLIPGLEFTHLPPALIPPLTAQARALGVPLIVVHGESLVEPVAPGTNRAAIEADVDILAHPGLITLEDAALARERGIFLEISARKGHCLANGHVARTALGVGASLIVDTDSHAPGDLITRHQAERIAKGAGLTDTAVQNLFNDAEALAQRLTGL